jgi:RNA polymerase sigma factor (sigma-70 family)
LQEAQRTEIQAAMIALSQGDRAAFRPLFRALWPLLRRFCLAALRDASLAEDAAQSALAKLFLHSARFDGERDAVSWALGFASFEILTLRKRKWRGEQGDAGSFAAHPGDAASPEDQAIERDLRAAAGEAVSALRPQDLETIRAVLDERRPQGPESVRAAFRKRVQRAVERARALWRSRHGID